MTCAQGSLFLGKGLEKSVQNITINETAPLTQPENAFAFAAVSRVVISGLITPREVLMDVNKLFYCNFLLHLLILYYTTFYVGPI